MPNKVQKFTTSTTGLLNQPPVAVLAVQKLDALIGSIIQLDGRQSFDPEKQPLSFKWSFTQVPIGSTVEDSGFRDIRPNSTAVSFIPDKTGVYIVQLIVNDGELDSTPTTALINIQISRVPCGENIIPDAHFLWSFFSNFWNLVEDREKITTTWSSTIQIIGAELIKLWEADNSKSIDTIQNTFQRRWQAFSAVSDLLGEFDQRVIAGKTDSGTNANTGDIDDVPGVETTQVVHLPLGAVGDITATDFTNLAGNYGAKGRVIIVNGECFTILRASNENLLKFSNGTATFDTTVATNRVTRTDASFVPGDVAIGDILVISSGSDAGTYLVSTLVSDTEFDVVLLDSSVPTFAGDTAVDFQLLRPFTLVTVDEDVIADGQVNVAWKIPQLLHIPSFNFEDEGVRTGDVLVFEVTRHDVGLTAELRAQVVGVDRARLGFEFTLDDLTGVFGTENISRPAFRQLVLDLKIVDPQATDNEIASAAEALLSYMPVGINLHTRPFSTYRLTFKAKKILHNKEIANITNLVSAPVLQEQVKDPPVVLRENLDYIVEDESVVFNTGLFTLEDPTPEIMWAECAIFDNNDVIENNFGLLVDLLQDELTAKQTRAPYLSAVKGLMFAYSNGPTVANIRLGLQILLGLPFTDERGLILEIDDTFSLDANGNQVGRFLIEDVDDNDNRLGVRRIFFFPTVVGVEDNPGTGKPFVAGEIVERFTPLSKGVDAVDYIKDPLWWIRALNGLEVVKFFTFAVLIDSDVFDSNDIQFAFEFVQSIKPAYTNVISTAFQQLFDDIEIIETVTGSISLKFYDNPWGLEATARADDDNQQGCVLWNVGSRPFASRTPKLLTDVVTFKSGTAVRASSATGWSISEVRAHQDGDSSNPPVEGDILVILRGQPGASALAPGLYEIETVVDANTIEFRQEVEASDPVTWDVVQTIDEDLFDFSTGLKCCILRRELNPMLRGTDLVTTVTDNVVTAALGNFLSNMVGVGDHLVIETGANEGEYIIDELLTPPVTFISATQVALVNTDGSIPSFSALSSQVYRVVRPAMQSKTLVGTALFDVRSFYTGARIELIADDTTTGERLDFFTPGMVGTIISVSNSDAPANDGDFMITEYLDAGSVVTDSVSVTTDAGANQSVFTLR